MFGKSKKDKDVNATESKPSKVKEKASKPAKKNKKESMASILNESVVDSVLVDVKSNTKFIANDGNEQKYVALLINSQNIVSNGVPGLNKKCKNDEAKGSFVECINNSSIKVLVTPALLDAEDLVIIPTDKTLETMSEFTMLTSAKYFLCYVYDDGRVEKTDKEITFDEASNVSLGNLTVNELLGLNQMVEEPKEEEVVAPEPSPQAYEDEPEYEETPEYEEEPQYVADEEPSYEETPYYEEEEPQYEEPVEEPSVEDEDYDYTADMADDIVDDEAYEEEDDDESEGEVVSREEVEAALSRVMNKDDLDIVIDSKVFDMNYLDKATSATFDVDYSGGWLSDQVAEIAKTANADIKQFKTTRLTQLREKYLVFLAIHAESVIKELDITHKNAKWFGRKQKLLNDKQEALENSIKLVKEREAEINKAWNEELESVGETGRRVAIEGYKKKNLERHNAELREARLGVEKRIEEDYQMAIDDLYRNRKDECVARMDYGVNQIIGVLLDEYKSILKGEVELYEYWLERINSFIDDNRKHEIARINVLKDEIDNNTKVNSLTQDYDAQMTELKTRFRDEKARLEADLDTNIKDFERQLREKEENCNRRIEDYKVSAQRSKEAYDELYERYKGLDEQKDMEYSARIKRLETERDGWEEQVKKADRSNSRVLISIGVVAFIAVIAVGAFGYILGMNKGIHSSNAGTAPVAEYNHK